MSRRAGPPTFAVVTGGAPPATCCRRSPSPRASSTRPPGRVDPLRRRQRGDSRPAGAADRTPVHVARGHRAAAAARPLRNLLMPFRLAGAVGAGLAAAPPAPARGRGLRRRLRQPAGRVRRPAAADPRRRRQLRPPPGLGQQAHRPLRGGERGRLRRGRPAPGPADRVRRCAAPVLRLDPDVTAARPATSSGCPATGSWSAVSGGSQGSGAVNAAVAGFVEAARRSA